MLQEHMHKLGGCNSHELLGVRRANDDDHDQDPLPQELLHLVTVLCKSAPKKEENGNHEQDPLKKDSLHTWSWPSESSF